MVTVDDNWSYCGLKAVVLENRELRMVVLPEFGANIWSLSYKPKNKELLWHHPRMKPRKVPFGTAYDDVFFGGWHVVFPNDIAETYGFEPLRDHGELWSVEWNYACQTVGDAAELTLSACGPVTPVEVKQHIVLPKSGKNFSIVYSLENIGLRPIDFMLKLHPALRIEPGDRIQLSCKNMHMEPIGYESRVPQGTTYEWPYYQDGNQLVDMSRVPEWDPNFCELQYSDGPVGGTCGLYKQADRLKLELSFDPGFFDTMCTFASFGAWRGLHVFIPEPATGKPSSLHVAKERGAIRTLQPGERLETVVVFSITDMDLDEQEGNIFGSDKTLAK